MVPIARTSLAVTLLFTSMLPWPAKAPAQNASTTIVVYTGHVDAQSAERFLGLISGSRDSVIGLDVTVQPSDDADTRYASGRDGSRLVISSGDPLNAPQEVVINGPVAQTWDMWRVDGFYLIKFGGMHAAGAMSWGALPVDEAALRLNPAIRVIRRPF
jgi:hypothetical protein